MSNYKVYVGNNSNQAQYVGQILDDASITKLANAATFPTQSGQSGKFLTTNGSEVSWANIINDTSTTATGQTWSANKLNTIIGNIESLINAL